jgi:GNAT superfamily N-acetyltransferase
MQPVRGGVVVHRARPRRRRPHARELAAFARAVTDYAYKALVLDVIVAAPHRGSGLGARIMDALMQHPKLAEVRHFELYCAPDMVPFYQRWDYTSDLGDLQFMRYSRST